MWGVCSSGSEGYGIMDFCHDTSSMLQHHEDVEAMRWESYLQEDAQLSAIKAAQNRFDLWNTFVMSGGSVL